MKKVMNLRIALTTGATTLKSLNQMKIRAVIMDQIGYLCSIEKSPV